MNPTKILWTQVLLVSAVVVAFVWGATEWVAWRLAFQPQLGHPWFTLLGGAVYQPAAFFWWWFAYDAYARDIFVEGAYIAASGGFAAVIIATAMSVWRAREAKRVTTYGSARWAEAPEVRGADLLGTDGVLLGRWRDEYLRHDGPEHVLCFAPTRSGKGVGLVVPTLLTWPGSAIVHDIKGENWSLTAGWRARFGRVLLFDPTNVLSAAYNPLLEVRRGEWEVRDVQNIADVLVDPEGALERRNHWEKTSHSLLVGAILHVLYAEADKTLAGVANFLSDPRRPIETTLRAMMTTPHLGMLGVHPVVASSARELLNKSDNERSGVLSTAMSFLGLYRDPVVAAVTRQCDWRIRDLVEGKTPATLYLVVPPSDISRTKPLVRLILNQIGRRLTEDLESKDRRHRLLLMLDEFPALGRLDFFENALAFMAGYGLKSFLIAQSLNQIEKAYGQNNSILDNCHVRVSFATNDERTAKRVSDALGTALTSHLFATTNVGPIIPASLSAPAQAAAATAAAVSNDLTSQDHKLAFLNGNVDRRTVSPDRVEAPAGPYVLQAGAVIPGALLTGLRSDLPGLVTAQVTEDVYDSPTGKFLLIPQGARLIGQYDAQVAFGQSRALLVWNRLIMPNGRSIVLERQPGADTEGYAGVEDQVDYHWGMLFKAAILSTVLSVGSEVGMSNNGNSLVQAIQQGGSQGVNQVGQQVVSRSLNIQPTITIRPGFPVRVIVNRDLVLEPYKG